MESHRGRLGAVLFLSVLVGATSGLVVTAPAQASPGDEVTARSLSNAFADAAEAVLPAVVTIQSVKVIPASTQEDPFFRFFHSPWGQDRPREQRGMGSGVIVRPDGIILTNNHVVENADELQVLLSDGRTFEAEIVGRDPKSDLAVIRLLKTDDEAVKDLPVASLANSDELRVGEWVLAVGSPFRLSQTVTAGIVSATGRANLRLAEYEDFIQTDAAINPGNSGGAMVTLDGSVVGINTAIATRSGAYQGVGFAIPINMANQVMESILEHGRVIRGFLGIMIQDVDSDVARALDLDQPHGALVTDVNSGSAAEKAGLRAEDVILEVGGAPVEDTKDLRFRISGTPPGTPVKLTVLRDGHRKDFTVVLDERPDEDFVPVASGHGNEMEEKLGLELMRLTPELRESLNLESGVFGAVIESVDAGSPASKAGLRRGDVIQEVHRTEVDSPQDFWEVVEHVGGGETVLLRVWRGGQRLFVGLTIPN